MMACTAWSQLPVSVQAMFGKSERKWRESVLEFVLSRQLAYDTRTCYVARYKWMDEKTYYRKVLSYSREKLMLYPYHLSHAMHNLVRYTPFRYCQEMMMDVMYSQRSYDSLPNFSAADGVRLLGIGRNQFIDAMNTFRGKSWIWRKQKSNLYELVPSEPVSIPILHWWIVHLAFVSEDDVRKASVSEHIIIDHVIDHGPTKAGQLELQCVESLYRKGLVYLEVPVRSTDCITIPPLQGFVMNRVLGDYFETIMYKIFVSIDERVSVEEMSMTLDMDLETVKHAVSMFLRLGFAKMKHVEPLEGPGWHPSWVQQVPDSPKVTPHRNVPMSPVVSVASSPIRSTIMDVKEPSKEAPKKRLGLVFDSTLTAFLMMGNLAPGLKTHAVTMFEVGKLADESVDEFLTQLDTVQPDGEGDAARYFDHAITLRMTLRAFRTCASKIEDSDGGVDLLRAERFASLDDNTRTRILRRNYAALVSMTPIMSDEGVITSAAPPHFGPVIPEAESKWWDVFCHAQCDMGPKWVVIPKGRRLRTIPEKLKSCEIVTISGWSNGSEAFRVPLHTFLPQANALLPKEALLVQAYDAEDDEDRFLDVPFPVYPDLEIDEHTRSVVSDIVERLHVPHAFGFVRFWRDAQDVAVPLRVHFGIPLFDVSLNEKVLKSIEYHNLLSMESIDAYENECRLLAIRFLHFVTSPKAEALDAISENVDASPCAHWHIRQVVEQLPVSTF